MPILAHIDDFTPETIAGWAWNSDSPGAAVRVTARLGNQIVGTACASIFRRDLLDANIGTGRYGFALSFARNLAPVEISELVIVVSNDGEGEIKLRPPVMTLTESKVRAPAHLSFANYYQTCKFKSEAKKVFDDTDWIDRYLQDTTIINVDFVTKQLILNRSVNICNFENYINKRVETDNHVAVQFWDEAEIPQDVMSTIVDNHLIFGDGRHFLSNDIISRDFVKNAIGDRAMNAYDYCHHPAMKSDYFRLCYLYACGGFYIDADDLILPPFHLIDLGKERILLSPLIRENALVDGAIYWRSLTEFIETAGGGRLSEVRDWSCVLANDLIATNALNEVIKVAVVRATKLIEACQRIGKRPNIHAVTGPDNITSAVAIHLFHSMLSGKKPSELIVFDRQSLMRQKRVSYKKDERYWVNAEKKQPGYMPHLLAWT